MKKLLTFFALLTMAFAVGAAEYPAPFKIKKIFVSGPSNFHFRIIADYTNINAWQCHNGPNNPAWSYINENDPGSKGMMSALLAAYMSGKTVKVVTEGVDTSAGHMCKILEFEIYD